MILTTFICWILVMVPVLMYQVPGEGGWGMLLLGWFMYLSVPALVLAFGMFVIGAYERRKMLAFSNGLLFLIGVGLVMFKFYEVSEYKRVEGERREKSILQAKERGDKFREVKVPEAERSGKELGEYVREKYSEPGRNSWDNQPANSTPGQ